MPARRRTLSPPSADLRLPLSDEPPASSSPSELDGCGEHGDEEKQPPTQQRNDSDGRCSGSQLSGEGDEDSEAENEEFILVQLEHIRKEVQCPICLGIIRKTRTVMECLHRFCRECIDKSMRLGNNECPACRTHCASRRSLRDDPNFDALIAALYPDIEKYEKEELALLEDEKSYYKKMQAYIAETYRRQSEAVGRKRSTTKDAIACGRKPQESYGNTKRKRGRVVGRNTGVAGSDYIEEEEAKDNDGAKASSSVDEAFPKPRLKRCKRWTSLSSTVTSANVGTENDVQVNKEPLGPSDLQAGNREMFAWGKNGTRSQSRHGITSGSNDKLIRGGRTTKLVDYLGNLDEADEFDVHLTLVPLDEESMPNLKQPYLCCRPTLSIRRLCPLVALETCMHAEEVEICTRRPQDGNPEGLQILDGQESLATVHASFAAERGELVSVYCRKLQSKHST